MCRHARVELRLSTGDPSIKGLQLDLWANAGIGGSSIVRGPISCEANPAINKTVQTSSLPHGCAGAECAGVRVVYLGFDNIDPIPDSVTIFSCDLPIAAAVAAGDYPVRIANVVVSTTTGAGAVVAAPDIPLTIVSTPPTPTATHARTSPTPGPGLSPTVMGSSGGGCSVARPAPRRGARGGSWAA